MPGISAAILCFNAADTLARCLRSLESVADEIVLADSGSTDESLQMAADAGARILHLPFSGFQQQREQAEAACSHPWILMIDADECLSEELRQSLLNWKKTAPEGVAFSFSRLNHFGDKPIRHGAWYPDIKPRLYLRGKARWLGGKVHEYLCTNDGSAPILMNGLLLHYPVKSAAEHFRKTERYARLAAEQKKDLPALKLILLMLFSPVWKFFRLYLLKAGWRDGKEGWWIARAAWRETQMKYLLALQSRWK